MKKIFFILFTLVAFINYGQSPLTDVNGKVITSATGDILVQEEDPNNFEYTPNAEWIPVNGVADNEIWILAFDGSGDGYSSFTCTTESSVDYAVDIYGGADGNTLLQTIDTASGKPIKFSITIGTGKYCYSEGYYTYKLVVRSTNPAKSILGFDLIDGNVYKIMNFGTKNITAIRCYRGDAVFDVKNEYLKNIIYLNIYYCTKIYNELLFYNTKNLEVVTMPKTMNLTNYFQGVLSGYSYNGGSFGKCTNLKYVSMPESMINVKYLGSGIGSFYPVENYMGLFAGCTALETINMKNSTLSNLLKLGGAGGNHVGFVDNCISLKGFNITLNIPFLKSFDDPFKNNYQLTSISTFTNLPTSSIPFSSTGLRALTTFNQPILRCSSFTLTGVSNADRSNLNYIQIDWANSQFTGNVDIRYNNLSATELNRIFTELPTVVVSRTIYVASNVGSATCDPTIATAKNWVVITS